MEYLIFIGALIAVVIIMKFFAWPIKKLIKLVINVLIGALLLLLVNYVGGNFFSFTIPFNWVTAAIVGFLGIPGVIILIIMQFIA